MRRLTWLTILILLVGVAGFAAWELAISGGSTAAPPRPIRADTPAAPLPTVQNTRGQRLVEQALATLNRRINVRAKLRQQTALRGKQLPGTGAYWQQGAGNQRRTRWEATTLVAGQKASLVQVFDSDELWTDRQLPSSREVTRVHLVRLSRELAASPEAAAASPAVVRECLQLASGGLAGMMAELLQRFDFDEPTSIRYGDTPALAVVGRWKPAALAKLAPEAAAGGAWPEQVPHHVLLLLGQADLFPYLIEYRGSGDAPLAASAAGRSEAAAPLARYEMFDVQFAVQMDPDLFRYTPPEDGARDITPAVRQRMREMLEAASLAPAAAESAFPEKVPPKQPRTENAVPLTLQPS